MAHRMCSRGAGARYPMLRHIFADGGYSGPNPRDIMKAIGHVTRYSAMAGRCLDRCESAC